MSKHEPVSLDKDVQLILTYVGKKFEKYNIDESGNLHVNSQIIVPYGTGRVVKYFGVCDTETLRKTLRRKLWVVGFDLKMYDGQEHPYVRALKKDPERFLNATYETCTIDQVVQIDFNDFKNHIDRNAAIVALNRELRFGFFTGPIVDYVWTDKELSDVSAERFIPGQINGRKK